MIYTTKKTAHILDTSHIPNDEMEVMIYCLGQSRQIECPISAFDLDRRKFGRYILAFFQDGTLDLFRPDDMPEMMGSHSIKGHGQDWRSFVSSFYRECRYWHK